MREIDEDLQTLPHDLMAFLAMHIDNETDAAGIVLKRRVVQTVRAARIVLQITLHVRSVSQAPQIFGDARRFDRLCDQLRAKTVETPFQPPASAVPTNSHFSRAMWPLPLPRALASAPCSDPSI